MVALDLMHKLVQELLSQSTAAPLVESPLNALSALQRGLVMGRWGWLYRFPRDFDLIAQRFRELPFAEQDFWVSRLGEDYF